MPTILRTSYVFGPVKSRRLGTSLGINILPIGKKICSFNCIYCECGWNDADVNENAIQDFSVFPKQEVIKYELESTLTEINNSDIMLDVITFSGNGEPTLHPNFAEIIDDTIELKNKFVPNTHIAVLSNSTNLHNEKIVSALKKIEKPILKLDSANTNTFNKMNMFGMRENNFLINKIIEGMKKFEGNFIFQIMFLRSFIDGKTIDNTTDSEVEDLIKVLKETQPKQVMIYPVDRQTPAKNLIKLDKDEMIKIATKIEKSGFNVLYV